jgi:VWFA-related protein
VLVPVIVTDAKGRFVDDLESSDFRILDNGRIQKAAVDAFATGVAPIALVIAVQSSGISAVTLEKVRKIGAMIQPLVTGERGCAALVSFAEQVHWNQDCTSDPDAFVRAFEELRPGEEKRGRMLDALQEAIDRLRKHSNARRVVLLISESRDRGSETDLASIVMEAQIAGVTIYAATYSAFKTAFTSKSSATGTPRPPKPPSRPSEEAGTVTGVPPSMTNPSIPPPEQRVDILGGIGELKRLHKEKATEVLTDATGGAVFPFTRQRALEDAIERLGTELHAQYLLSFAPEDPAPGYHHLEVRIKRRGEFHIRARPGYWATTQPR